MHPAIAKAQQIASAAKEYDWHGSIESEVRVGEALKPVRVTGLSATRNDEQINLTWHGNQMVAGWYSIFDHAVEMHSAKDVFTRIKGWPDLAKLIKACDKTSDTVLWLIKRYRQLPFDVETDSDATILGILSGRHIWWYSELSGKVHDEWVMEPRRKSQVYNLRNIKDRKLFNFTTAETGMRSVLLDTILKVA